MVRPGPRVGGRRSLLGADQAELGNAERRAPDRVRRFLLEWPPVGDRAPVPANDLLDLVARLDLRLALDRLADHAVLALGEFDGLGERLLVHVTGRHVAHPDRMVGLGVLVTDTILACVDAAVDWLEVQALTMSKKMSALSTNQYRFKVSP